MANNQPLTQNEANEAVSVVERQLEEESRKGNRLRNQPDLFQSVQAPVRGVAGSVVNILDSILRVAVL